MKNRNSLVQFITVLVFMVSSIYSQAPNWQVFSNLDIGISETRILSIVEDNNSNIWIGTMNDGLIKYDGVNWTVFDTTNSLLPVNTVWTIAVDSMNNKWIGTYGEVGGLTKFDETNWTVYNLADYGIDGNSIFDIEIDKDGNFWMGTYWNGLVKFDGTDFTIYNSSTSGLDPSFEEINCVAIDSSGYIWIGSDFDGVARFDRISEWNHHYALDSVIESSIYSLEVDNFGNILFGGINFISELGVDTTWTLLSYPDASWYTSNVIDSNNVKWYASWTKGLLKFDNQGSTHLFPANPDLSNMGAWANTMDKNGNIWVGYNNGHIAIYNENGLVTDNDITENNKVITDYILRQNYPNPFNPSTIIRYEIGDTRFVTLKIYNVLGQEVAVLVNREQRGGSYEVEFDASNIRPAQGNASSATVSNLTSGIYFYRLHTSTGSATSFVESRKMILIK